LKRRFARLKRLEGEYENSRNSPGGKEFQRMRRLVDRMRPSKTTSSLEQEPLVEEEEDKASS